MSDFRGNETVSDPGSSANGKSAEQTLKEREQAAGRLPKNETLWMTRVTENGEVFFITSKEDDRRMYFLYKVDALRPARIGKARTPAELEERYIDATVK